MTAAADAEFDLTAAAIHLRAGRLPRAEAAGRAVLAASAGMARLPALRLLAAALGQQGRDAEAAEVLAEAASFDAEGGGRDPECWNDLGVALEKIGEPAAAEAAYRRALSLRPDFPEVQPGNAALGSALLYNLHHSERVTPGEMFEAHRAWARRHASGTGFQPVCHGRNHGLEARATETPLCHPVLAAFFAAPSPPEPRTLNPEPSLRIGYVSPDFREHPVARFLEPVLANHDRSRFEVYCYSDVRPGAEDAVTGRLRGMVAVWRQVRGMPDARVAEMVRADGIDILVDLTGHMAGYRPLLFARKPAAVQVAYIGYPDTTGMGAMDYKVTDSLHDPPGETEHLYTEKLVRLDPCCWCYGPDEDAPEVGPLPALSCGFVTFGVLNRLVKASPTVMRLWAKVLDAVPNSRLTVLVAAGAEGEPAYRTLFTDAGIEPERVVFVGRRKRLEYLGLFHDVDIALDTFPYNGHTTTLDAAWMGVPTVSLAGRAHTQRAGPSVLSAMGLGDEFVGHTPQEYVEKAATLASDLPKLAEMRSGLRERMRRSPLCDGPAAARALERAYRQMWSAHLCGT